MIAGGLAVKYSSDLLEKREANLEDSFNFVLSRLGPLLGAGIVSFVLVVVGLICLLVPGVILAIMFSLVNPLVIIEGVNAFESLGRSKKLVDKRWGITFKISLVVLIIQFIVGGIGSVISGPFGPSGWVVTSVVGALIGPIFPLVTTLFYYSMRARETRQKETADRSADL
jgi:hypothetical protein